MKKLVSLNMLALKCAGFILVMLTLSFYNANAQSRNISLKASNVTVNQALDMVRNASKLNVIFSPQEVDLNKKVSFNFNNTPILNALENILSGQNLKVTLVDDRVIISKAEATKGSKRVIGEVKNRDGELLPGVSIQVKGSSRGIATDINGKFSLDANAGESLVFSFVGYETQIIAAQESPMNVVLALDDKQLEEVIVVGYGTNTKGSLISSVSTVKTESLASVPSSNITQSLAGRAPGLIVKANGGGVNKQSTISIRGGSAPLVVIDGIIRAYNDFVTLAPEDIESFSILKDASATAVYGSRAANGILQITTKKGKSGETPKVEYNFSQSFAEPTIFPDKLDSYNRAYYRNLAAKNDGLALPFTDEDLRLYQDGSDPFGHANTDWRKVTLRRFAPQSKHNIKLYGGSDVNQYYVSLGYIDQGSLYRTGTYNMDRTNFRLSQSSVIKSINLKVSSQIDGYIQKDDHPYTSSSSGPGTIFLEIQDRYPWQLAYNNFGLPYTQTYNPVSDASKDAGYIKNKDNVVNGMLSLDWQPLDFVKELHFRGTGSYRYTASSVKQWRKDPAQYRWDSTDPQLSALSQLYKSMASGYSYTLQFLADYNKTIGKHSISALAGYEVTYGFSESLWGARDSYQFDIDQIEAGPVSTMKNGGAESESGRAGYVGQVKYGYDNRYFVEGSIRYDGSDNFPKDKRWGTFFSGSLGWAAGNEAFMESLRDKNILNSLKFRASYGEVGLDNWGDPYAIGRFAYLPSYSYRGQAYVINNIIVPGFSEGAIPSPDLTWFTTTQVDIGFDFSSLNNRLYGSVDYFYYKTKGFLYQPDQLKIGYVEPLGIALPKVSTDGEHRRAGWEFQLGYQDNIGEFKYDISGNFTVFDQLWARNPSESLEAKKNPYKRTTQQQGYWGIGYQNQGFYQDENDIYNSVKRLNSTNLASGDIKYYDFNGDGVIDGQDQIRIGKNGFPRGNFGFNIGLSYKGFSLNMLFQGATRFDMELGDATKMNSAQTGTTPVYDYHLDFWSPENTNAKFPRLTSSTGINGNNNHPTSDFWLVNGAYLRFKDVQFKYDFKRTVLKDVNWLSSLNVFVSGQNLFTISEATKYGLDPENASTNNYAYPLERTFAFGVTIGF